MLTEEKPTPTGNTFKYGEVVVREKARYKKLRKVHHLPEYRQLSFVEILEGSIR